MAGMRDKMIHAYHGVDLAIMWETASKTIPGLMPRLERVAENEGAGSGHRGEAP